MPVSGTRRSAMTGAVADGVRPGAAETGATIGAMDGGAAGGAFPAPGCAPSTSFSRIRPPGPDPVIVERSTPREAATFLASGDAFTRAPSAGFAEAGAGTDGTGAGAEAGAGAVAAAAGAGAGLP